MAMLECSVKRLCTFRNVVYTKHNANGYFVDDDDLPSRNACRSIHPRRGLEPDRIIPRCEVSSRSPRFRHQKRNTIPNDPALFPINHCFLFRKPCLLYLIINVPPKAETLPPICAHSRKWPTVFDSIASVHRWRDCRSKPYGTTCQHCVEFCTICTTKCCAALLTLCAGNLFPRVYIKLSSPSVGPSLAGRGRCRL